MSEEELQLEDITIRKAENWDGVVVKDETTENENSLGVSELRRLANTGDPK